MKTTVRLFLACAQMHGGQASRGYRLLSKLSRRLKRHGVDPNAIKTHAPEYSTGWEKQFAAKWFKTL